MKLHLGCGRTILADYVNADINEGPQVQPWNAMEFPWPWESSTATEIRAIDLLEHLPSHTDEGRATVIAFVEEAWRVLKPHGVLYVQVPEWDSDHFKIDPTHVRGFHVRSMEYFDPRTELGKTFGYYSPCKFRVTATVSENHNVTFLMEKAG